jgi:hypothetical protein
MELVRYYLDSCWIRNTTTVARAPDYRYRVPGFDSRRYQIFLEVMGLEQGPLSLMRITVELLEWKVAARGLENRLTGMGISCTDHAIVSIHKSWH